MQSLNSSITSPFGRTPAGFKGIDLGLDDEEGMLEKQGADLTDMTPIIERLRVAENEKDLQNSQYTSATRKQYRPQEEAIQKPAQQVPVTMGKVPSSACPSGKISSRMFSLRLPSQPRTGKSRSWRFFRQLDTIDSGVCDNKTPTSVDPPRQSRTKQQSHRLKVKAKLEEELENIAKEDGTLAVTEPEEIDAQHVQPHEKGFVKNLFGSRFCCFLTSLIWIWALLSTSAFLFLQQHPEILSTGDTFTEVENQMMQLENTCALYKCPDDLVLHAGADLILCQRKESTDGAKRRMLLQKANPSRSTLALETCSQQLCCQAVDAQEENVAP